MDSDATWRLETMANPKNEGLVHGPMERRAAAMALDHIRRLEAENAGFRQANGDLVRWNGEVERLKAENAELLARIEAHEAARGQCGPGPGVPEGSDRDVLDLLADVMMMRCPGDPITYPDKVAIRRAHEEIILLRDAANGSGVDWHHAFDAQANEILWLRQHIESLMGMIEDMAKEGRGS